MSERRELSRRLNDVLEMVGVTEEMRSYHRRRARTSELLNIVTTKRKIGIQYNSYMCGSSWEGTVTPDLASDIDTIICINEKPVVPHRAMAGPGLFMLMIRDKWTRPGYVKLQLMLDGRPLTVYDEAASSYVDFDGEGRACLKYENTGTMHGPAHPLVDDSGKHLTDTVFAWQCKDIPLFATDWITRRRLYNWPSQQLIDELKMMGCLCVGVGHFKSRDKELEWRVSFSLQERMLMESLNSTQYRVYVLLKMIKKDILEKCLNAESLSSYHCKTCVFYMVETTPASMWVPENIINCLLKCLSRLLQWIRKQFCPSFFLQDSNLFDKDGFSKLAGPLEMYISLLLQTGQLFLYTLQSDRVGEMLRAEELMLYKTVSESSINKYILNSNRGYVGDIITISRCLHRPHNIAQDSLSAYMTELENLQHCETLPGCTEDEYKTTVRYVLPWLHLSIGLEFAARAVTYPDRYDSKELINKANYHMQQARNTDIANAILAQATIFLKLGKLKECYAVSKELDNRSDYCIYTICPCSGRDASREYPEEQLCEIAAKCRGMTLSELMRTRSASCVIFDRSQIELVPTPLRYEMYRSLYTQSGSRDERSKAWFDRAAVDARVYLDLLQYLVCSKLNWKHQKQIAIDHISAVPFMAYHKKLIHRETIYNLLGWVYLQENRISEAGQCFLQSWKIRPHHNAAKFHMLDVCLRLMEARTQRQNNA